MKVNALSEKSVSLWMTIKPLREPALDRPISVDVAVIGSGIAGASAAYELSLAGLSVAVLDRGILGRGITARTSAHLTFQSDDLYQEVIARRGLQAAKIHYRSQRAAVDRIEENIKTEMIACDFTRLEAVMGLARGQDPKVLDDELKACHQVGYPEVRKASKRELTRLKTRHGLVFPEHGRFHPLRYLDGLLRAAKRHGATLYENTCVTDIEETPRGVTLKTAGGHRVRARQAIIATNGPIATPRSLHIKQAPWRTYVFAAPVRKGAIADYLYWDTEDPYHYVRLQPRRGSHDMLIAGGEDHRTGAADDAEARYRKLERWTRARFPEIGKTAYRWSGQVLDPIDFTAFIGRSPGRERIFLATGDSGQGLTHGTIAGMLLRDLIVEGGSHWEGVYRPDRKTARGLLQFASDNLAAAQGLADYVTPGDISSAQELKPGEGGILREGLHKVAVARDARGRLHRHAAVCTHSGCLVRWNSFEACWDSPCFGSHYAPDGEVLNGPAITALAPAAPKETR